MENIEELTKAHSSHLKDAVLRRRAELSFIEGYKQGQMKWISLDNMLPNDGQILDIVVFWPKNHKQEERKGYIFKSKHPIVDWVNFFQHLGFYENNLYEESFGVDENLVTHWRLHDPLPSPPNI